MKNKRIIALLLSAALLVTIASGCKKEESEAPVVLYYGETQQEATPGTITFESSAAPAQANETEPLAPILADRTQTNSTMAAANVEQSQETAATTAETTAPSETTAPAETTAETTAAAQSSSSSSAETPAIAAGSHIYDNAGVISDESSVNSAMNSFETNTGVSPAIFTIRNELSGDEFRQYARDLYSSNFEDQDHVLVVYQLTPAGTWSWTCVFGSNTGTVFTQDNINSFQTDLTDAFSSGNVDSALVNTFTNTETQT